MKKIISVLVAVLTPLFAITPAAAVEKDALKVEGKVEKKVPMLTFYYFDK